MSFKKTNWKTIFITIILLFNTLALFLTFPTNIIPQINDQNYTDEKEKSHLISEIKTSDINPVYKPSRYNRQAAYGYAYRWYNDRNPNYNDYTGSGGDCANFVSQCLIAGGLSLHNGTDGTGFGVYSTSYGAIPFCDYLNLNLRNYQNVNVTFVNEGSEYVPDEITIGDVVMFGDDPGDNWEHAMVVVWDGGTEIGLAGHTSDEWNRTFSSKLGTSYYDCATFYHFNESDAEFYHFKVDTGALNVRAGPASTYQDIGNIYDGDEYIAFGREKDGSGRYWWHFWFDDRAAWTASWYTENVTGNKVVEVEVNNYLNVRDGADTGYDIYGQVYDGMRFVSDTTDGSWYRFWYGGEQKYSHGNYMEELQLQNNTYTNFSKPVMGFLPYWVDSDQNFSIISHLAWFSVELNADGTIGNRHGWPDWDVIDAVHEAGNRIVLTATLFDDDDIRTLLTSYKQTTADNLLAEVQAGNADGICIDFELPKSGDGELLEEFMDILYTTFKNARNDYHVSLCTPSVDWRGTFDYGDLDPYVDAFMLMGYGYSWSGSDEAGPTAPLESGGKYTWNLNWSVNDHLDKGASKSKLILGLPFYGYDWPVDDSSMHSDTRGSGSSRTYSYIHNTLIPTYTPTLKYNEDYECAWFSYFKAGDGWRQIWYDNYTSLERKFDYINNRDLGGLGIWAYGYQGDYTELEDLIQEKFMRNDTFSYSYPGEFTLITNATDPDTDGNFYLNWSQSDGADYYSVYYSKIQLYNPGSGKVLASNLTSNYTYVSNYFLSGNYYFAVSAYNDTGGTLSNNININISLPLDLTSSAGSPDKDGDFYLYWDEVESADNYTLYSWNNPITEVNDSLTIVQEEVADLSHQISGIANDTEIYYIVIAQNQFDNVSSNYIRVQVLFGPPGEFVATCTAGDPDDDGDFDISWTLADAATKYSIYRSTEKTFTLSDPSWIDVIIDTVTPNQHITGLDEDTHYLVVVAYNDYGNSSSNFLTVVVDLPGSSKDDDEEEPAAFDFMAFLTSPVGLTLMGIGGAAILGGIAIKLIKKHSYKSTLKEREKLENVSQSVKLAQKHRKKKE